MASGLVKVSELKNRLSHYLRQVRRGEVLLICDRDRVIARLEPAGDQERDAPDDARWIADLERRGTLRRARARLARTWRTARPAVQADVVGALLAEREDGR